jgi:hypothetical protein
MRSLQWDMFTGALFVESKMQIFLFPNVAILFVLVSSACAAHASTEGERAAKEDVQVVSSSQTKGH